MKESSRKEMVVRNYRIMEYQRSEKKKQNKVSKKN